MKWEEFLQIYAFVLKHRSGNYIRAADGLSRRQSLLTKMQVEVVSFNHESKKLYEGYVYFGETWRYCKEPIAVNRKKRLDSIESKMVCYLEVINCVFLEAQ